MAVRSLSTATRALAAGWQLTAELTPLGEGHINETLLAATDTGERFVLQRISRAVFTDPGRVMHNVARVIGHLESHGAALVPALLPTRSGGPAFVDDAGEWWRLWAYVADGRSLARTSDPLTCRAAGEAFGRFQRLLADLPGPALEPVIPGFLELGGYLERFDQVLRETDNRADVNRACGDPAFIDAHRELAGRFPPRQDLIHGDCKLNNLLFAADTPKVLAVLDLDTVMVGHWAWDLGDLARSVLLGAASTSGMQTAFAALLDGFSAGSSRSVDPSVAIGATVYVAFMLGIRFLTDHLEGDRYFRVERPGVNLDRARAQFDLVQRLTTRVMADGLASSVAPAR